MAPHPGLTERAVEIGEGYVTGVCDCVLQAHLGVGVLEGPLRPLREASCGAH